MCFWFLVWFQVILNEIYQRKVALKINIKMLVPCQSALVLLRYFFKVKLTFEMLTVRGQLHSFFDTRTGVLGKVSRFFETENVSTWGGLEHPTFGFMPNALTYWAIRARHLLPHVVEYRLWWYRYFWSKINIWNVNCARATAFIFDTRMVVLGKVSKFLRQKMSRPEGYSNPQPSD